MKMMMIATKKMRSNDGNMATTMMSVKMTNDRNMMVTNGSMMVTAIIMLITMLGHKRKDDNNSKGNQWGGNVAVRLPQIQQQ